MALTNPIYKNGEPSKETKTSPIRFFLIVSFFLLLLVLIGFRAYQLQWESEPRLKKIANRQHQTIIQLVPHRGAIYDRNGEELALSIEVSSLWANPKEIENRKLVAKKLSKILNLSYFHILKLLNVDRSFVWIKRLLSPQLKNQVEALNVKGLYFIKEYKRFYPNYNEGAHLIGFAGMDSRGLEGIELKYDRLLVEPPNFLKVKRDGLGRIIHLDTHDELLSSGSCNIYLAMDSKIQHIAEEALDKGVKKTKAKAGMAVVMNPFTGEVLACAVKPGFNPNAFSRFKASDWRNRVFTDTFEPGSIFKTFLLAAALQSRTVRPSDIFYCENGSYIYGGRVIHDVKKHGWLTVSKIIKYSSNIGAAKIGEKIGRKKLFTIIKNFGFGKSTLSGFPGEASGMVRAYEKWSNMALANISFGQGIAVTPIQVITAFSAIANGGLLLTPILVKKVVDENSDPIWSAKPNIKGRVIDPIVASQVNQILKMVVSEDGTGRRAQIEGFEVAGKTGTAQKPSPDGGYYSDRYVSSFMGYVPANKPSIAILVIIDEPKGPFYGGVVAAPIFKEIAKKSLQHLGVMPDQFIFAKKEKRITKRISVDKKSPVRCEKLNKKVIIPDFSGLTIREVLKAINGTGLNIRCKGNGRVVAQYPAPGKEILKGGVVIIRLSPFL